MIQDTYGTDVEITEAEQIRKGGVGGFFAKELFRVSVELPDTAPKRVASVMDLIDEIQDEVPVMATAGASLRTVATGSALPATFADALDRAIHTRSDTGRAESPAEPTMEDELEDAPFVDLRQAIRDQRRREAGDRTALADSAPIITPDMHELSTERTGFADVLARISEQSSVQERVSEAPTGPDGGQAPARQEPESHSDVDATELRPDATPIRRFRAGRSSVEPARVAGGSPARPGVAAAPASRARAPLSHTFDSADLVRLGLPPQFLRRQLTAGDQLGALLELAASFPVAEALPRSGDAVICLVGDRRGMLEVATYLNEALGLNPDRLMVASRRESEKLPTHRRIESIEAAESQRRNWRRKEHPMLVVVDEPVNRVKTAWSRHVIDALEPSAIWGVVDAQRKPEDIIDWASKLGGVDALAVAGTEETMSPAAVLTTGIPVSLIDGRPASAARWAALLDERLYAA